MSLAGWGVNEAEYWMQHASAKSGYKQDQGHIPLKIKINLTFSYL